MSNSGKREQKEQNNKCKNNSGSWNNDKCFCSVAPPLDSRSQNPADYIVYMYIHTCTAQ